MKSWAIAEFRELVAFVIGGDWGKAPNYEDTDFVDVLCIRGTELRNWKTERANTAAHRRVKKSSLTNRELSEGDLIIEISGGGPEQPVGRVELIDRQTLRNKLGFPSVCTNFFRKIRLVDEIEPAYITYYLKLFYLTGQIRDYQGGSNNLRNLKYTAFERIEIPIAPIREQNRIVEKIETLFARLDKGEEGLRAVQTLLARYRQSVLKAAVTGELTADWRAQNAHRLEHGRDLLARILQTRRETWQGRGKYKEPVAPDTSDLPELPEGWVWASVDQTVKVFMNGLSKKPALEPNEFPILRISATRAMNVSLNDLRYYQPSKNEDITPYWVECGDLLFTRYNGSSHLVGVCGQMRNNLYVLHPDKLIKARPVSVHGLFTDYLEVAWNCGFTRTHIAANIKTTSGQQGISGSDIKAAPFPLPPAEEQEEIVEIVRGALSRIEAMQSFCEAELKRSSALRQSILKDAFSGRLVPQDPEDEPAAELLARIQADRDAASNVKKPGAGLKRRAS